jgi:hypothetical protein
VFVLVRLQKYKQTNAKNKGRKKLFADDPLAALAAIYVCICYRPYLATLDARDVEEITRVPNILWNHYDGGRTRQQVAEFVFHIPLLLQIHSTTQRITTIGGLCLTLRVYTLNDIRSLSEYLKTLAIKYGNVRKSHASRQKRL